MPTQFLEFEIAMQPDSIVPQLRTLYRVYDPAAPVKGAWDHLDVASNVSDDDWIESFHRAIRAVMEGWTGDVSIRFDRSLASLANCTAHHFGLSDSATVEINDCGVPSFMFNGWAYAFGETEIYLYREVD